MIIDSSLCPFTDGRLCTFLWAIIPLLEMRAAVPLGITTFHLGFWETIFYSFLGGFVAAVVCLLILPRCLWFLKRFLPRLHNWVQHKILDRTRKHHSTKMKAMGEIFLVLFVAIPIPGSGAFTGALLCYLFGIRFWASLGLLSLGILGSNLIMGFLTRSGIGIWDWVMGLL